MVSMPQEIEVKFVLPKVRSELVRQMLEIGLKQNDIAQRLGITKSAVSQYLKEKRGTKENIFDEEIKKKIKIAAKRIVEDNATANKEIRQLLSDIRESDNLCKIHKTYEQVKENCRFCFE